VSPLVDDYHLLSHSKNIIAVWIWSVVAGERLLTSFENNVTNWVRVRFADRLLVMPATRLCELALRPSPAVPPCTGTLDSVLRLLRDQNQYWTFSAWQHKKKREREEKAETRSMLKELIDYDWIQCDDASCNQWRFTPLSVTRLVTTAIAMKTAMPAAVVNNMQVRSVPHIPHMNSSLPTACFTFCLKV
jgi:hypothetical protein